MHKNNSYKIIDNCFIHDSEKKQLINTKATATTQNILGDFFRMNKNNKYSASAVHIKIYSYSKSLISFMGGVENKIKDNWGNISSLFLLFLCWV